MIDLISDVASKHQHILFFFGKVVVENTNLFKHLLGLRQHAFSRRLPGISSCVQIKHSEKNMVRKRLPPLPLPRFMLPFWGSDWNKSSLWSSSKGHKGGNGGLFSLKAALTAPTARSPPSSVLQRAEWRKNRRSEVVVESVAALNWDGLFPSESGR